MKTFEVSVGDELVIGRESQKVAEKDVEMTRQASSRLEVVDALRGFTLLGIMLLHNIEHFDAYTAPADIPHWLGIIDQGLWKLSVFLFAGKAYGIFALLFGFGFCLQLNRQGKRDRSFKARFLWRLFLLLILGVLNSMFYKGDILVFYALLGCSLIPVSKWGDTAVFILAIILFLQPVELIKISNFLINADHSVNQKLSETYFSKVREYKTSTSFLDVAQQNLTNGKAAVFFWSWESGRILQTLGLFMVGMLFGRHGRFYFNPANTQFWARVFIFSSALFIPLLFIKISISGWVEVDTIADSLKTIITSWFNLVIMLLVISSFLFLYSKKYFNLNRLSAVGRMSLTNYVMQCILGSVIYYEYGLGLYKYSGATFSLLLGLLLFAMQFYISDWWLKRYKQGPLEYALRRATWMW